MVTVTKNALGLNYPGKPTSLSVNVVGNHADLTWVAPVANGGSAITDYVVEYKTAAASTWTTFNDGTSTTASASVTGLSGSTNYDFRVSAANSNGTGNPVTASSSTSDLDAPVISGTTVAVAPANTSATIAWTTDELSSSYVDYGITSAYGHSTVEADTSPRVLSHSVEITSLLPCAIYHFRVKSADALSNLATGGDTQFQTEGCTVEVLESGSSQITDATGGTIAGSSYQLDIPVGAAGVDASFQIMKLDSTGIVDAVGLPSGFLLSGDHTYEFKAYEDIGNAITTFNQPITVTIQYDDSDVVGLNESSLVIYHYSSGVWSALTPCTVDVVANTVSCSTSSFSVFALMGNAQASSGTSSGSYAKHPLGTNIKTTDGTIYTLTADGKRKPYTSAGAFLSYGFNSFATVVNAWQGDLNLQIGEFIPPRDGSITCSDRGTDKGTCYLITGGAKAGFTSEKVFKALGFSFANALYGDVSFMPSTLNISTADESHRAGVLVNNNGTLQIIGQSGLSGSSELIGIPSMETLSSWGYSLNQVVPANVKDKMLKQTSLLSLRKAGVLNF
jgi:hypothetical protein